MKFYLSKIFKTVYMSDGKKVWCINGIDVFESIVTVKMLDGDLFTKIEVIPLKLGY